MSLKNICEKIIATSALMIMLTGNFGLLGTGLSEVIAEDINNASAPEIQSEVAVEKYVQYDANGTKGVVLKTKVTTGDNQSKDNYMPVQNKDIQVQVPTFNSKKPQRVKVIAKSTKATNGKEAQDVEFNENNWNYNQDSGLLTIATENQSDKDGNIYSTYVENAKDEFEIIYIYDSESYTGNENEIEIPIKIDFSEKLKSNNGTVESKNSIDKKVKLKNNIGDIVTLEGKTNSNIYKGYIYSNVENNTNYETEYETVSNLDVLNSELMDNINADLKNDEFVLSTKEGNKNISSNESIYFKTTQIFKNDFDKILGIDGELQIFNAEDKIATIKYGQPDKKKNRKLQIEYASGDVKEVSDNNIIVEYANQYSNLTIKTTKPQTEGTITITNKKVIKATKDLKKSDVDSLSGIKENTEVTTTKNVTTEIEKVDENGETQKEQVTNQVQISKLSNTRNIELKEPTKQMSVELNNSNLSTLTTNRVTMTIKLNNTNNSCALFGAGKLEVTLPSNLTSSKANVKALYTNGLQFKKAEISNGKLIISVDGSQKNYDIENISGGVNVVIDLELDIANNTPSHEETIDVTFDNAKVSKKINIVSKSGLLLLNKVSFGEDEATLTDSTLKTFNTEINDSEKTIVQNISVVNNYSEQIKDLTIIGQVNSIDEQNKSNTKLYLNSVKVKGAQVYYSDKNNIDANDQSWTTKQTENTQTYKIVFEKVDSKQVIDVQVGIKVPEKLTYNVESYVNTEVKYQYGNGVYNQNSKYGILTKVNKVEPATTSLNEEQKQEAQVTTNNNVELTILPSISGNTITTEDKINEGQIVKYQYEVKNNSNVELNNLKLQTTAKNAIYYEIRVTGENGIGYTREYVEAEQGDVIRTIENITIPANQTYNVEYLIKVNKGATDTGIDVKIFDTNNNVLVNKDITNSVKVANLSLKTKYEYNEEKTIYSEDTLNFAIDVTNITDTTLQDISVSTTLPNEIYYDFENRDKYLFEENYSAFDEISMDGQTLNWKINSLNAGETKTIYVRTLTKAMDVKEAYRNISLLASAVCGGETYKSNVLERTINQNRANVSFNFEPSLENNSKLKNGDEVTYKVTITNNGVITLNELSLEAMPDTGFVAKSLKIVDQDGKETNISVDNDINISNMLLEPGKTVTITYVLAVNEEDMGTADKELSVTTNITTGYKDSFESTNTYEVERNIDTSDDTNEDFDWSMPDFDDDDNKQDDNKQDDNKQDDSNKDDNKQDDNKQDNNNKDNSKQDDNKQDNNQQQENVKYTVSGTAWLDLDKNGQRDNGETLLSNIEVLLLNTKTGEIVKDSNGNNISTKTSANGEYSFTDIEKGTYIVIFEFDTSKYTVTSYKKDGVDGNSNSDAIISNANINGTNKVVAVTDALEITTTNLTNIDIGLIENATFDLSLDKQISKIEVVNNQGTKTTNYTNKNFAKVDLVAKYMNNTNVIVTYKFIITNNGDVTGYVDKLIDNLPSGLEFNSELNKDWYKGSDGNLYTTSLTGIAIEPGKTSEVELILTKKTTEDTTGTFSNNAELAEISNVEAIEEKQDAKQNDKSSADMVISIKTGSVAMYLGITIGCIAIIGAGAYVIKKKVINKEI